MTKIELPDDSAEYEWFSASSSLLAELNYLSRANSLSDVLRAINAVIDARQSLEKLVDEYIKTHQKRRGLAT